MQSTTDSLDCGTIGAIPLHAVSPKQFDWDLFARMHGTELCNGPP